MRDRFNQPESGAGWDLMIVLAVVACVFGIVYLLNRWQQRRLSSVGVQPMRLYLRVQRKLGLPLVDRWRLWRLASGLNIEHPAALLISVGMYDEAIQRYCAGWGWFGSRIGAAPHFASIRERLFPEP